jgi:hypothetical protein
MKCAVVQGTRTDVRDGRKCNLGAEHAGASRASYQRGSRFWQQLEQHPGEVDRRNVPVMWLTAGFDTLWKHGYHVAVNHLLFATVLLCHFADVTMTVLL